MRTETDTDLWSEQRHGTTEEEKTKKTKHFLSVRKRVPCCQPPTHPHNTLLPQPLLPRSCENSEHWACSVAGFYSGDGLEDVWSKTAPHVTCPLLPLHRAAVWEEAAENRWQWEAAGLCSSTAPSIISLTWRQITLCNYSYWAVGFRQRV